MELLEDAEATDRWAAVEIEDPENCPRYTARMVVDVEVRPSPFWLRRRLQACGLRAINNLVDVTNYVMLEYGQPLHAFDFTCLRHGRIVVRRPQPQESTFTTLDGQDRAFGLGDPAHLRRGAAGGHCRGDGGPGLGSHRGDPPGVD